MPLNDRRGQRAPPPSRCTLRSKQSNCRPLPSILFPIIGEEEPKEIWTEQECHDSGDSDFPVPPMRE